ncbi:MlaC/ttg2D family ABC transporter substrate-binding protein [Herminiimonas fonticola]|uniref:Phospholipid transport system substrate-binding protein n=1 Tax=Herminiimonas fonticola TaxID=303380 RepID=A0A4R6GHY7_9BURK|nr:ABC transporter substrate-binding protein [Herminiimonas fonticola]RBA24886.1 ABC-type transport system involved in resistance to organic solvents auxiliary component [Herminiimonas fonticola]TDN94000.1 phospholipid transport system substrate-binding protein [Herminiimonas fonticola]
MKLLKKLMFAAAAMTFAAYAAAQEAPDVLVKRISEEVMAIAKSDKEIQNGNSRRVQQVVEEKILPHVDFQRMTSLAAGRHWREATPDQQKQLTTEFRSLLVYTYSGAISQIRDQKLEYRPLRADPADTEVIVNTQVLQARNEPIQLSYRLAKSSNSWKIYDINVLGAWLVETYKGSFATEISKGGVDGLIKTLSDKNKKLAGSIAKTGKTTVSAQ